MKAIHKICNRNFYESSEIVFVWYTTYHYILLKIHQHVDLIFEENIYNNINTKLELMFS